MRAPRTRPHARLPTRITVSRGVSNVRARLARFAHPRLSTSTVRLTDPSASLRVPSPVLTTLALSVNNSLFQRRRWCNQLNPTVKRGPFTEEEDEKIIAAHAVYGNKWALISRGIPGRYVPDARARLLGTHAFSNSRSAASGRLVRLLAVLSLVAAEPSRLGSAAPRARVFRSRENFSEPRLLFVLFRSNPHLLGVFR